MSEGKDATYPEGKKLPYIPSNASLEVDADGGKTYHFTVNMSGSRFFAGGPRVYNIYISKDSSRVIKEEWIIKGNKQLKESREETLNGLKDGIQEVYDEEGRLCKREEYCAGVRSGVYEYYGSYGGMCEKGQYKNGKKDGKWISKGLWSEEITYLNGKYHGLYKKYVTLDDKKELSERCNFVNGKRSGICERYTCGILYTKIGYVDGKRDGIYVKYALDGKTPVVMGQYSKGEMTGEWTYYLKDNLVDKIENYKDGKKHGICKTCYYRPSKQYGLEIDYFVEENYVNGIKEGEFPYEEFDKNGELVLKGSIINNKKEGIWNHYQSNELVVQDFYVNDELVGSIQSNIPPVKSKEFIVSPDDKKRDVLTKEVSDFIYKYEAFCYVKDGRYEEVKDGLYQKFDCNDRLIEEGYYCLGKKVGVWKQYDEEGFLFTELPYEDGKVKGIVKHYLNGELCKRIFVSEGKKEEECPFERYFKGEIVTQGKCTMYNDDKPDVGQEREEQEFYHGVPEKK